MSTEIVYAKKTALETIESKMIDLTQLQFLKAYWKFRGQKVVFSNGCFDLLHRGHVEYLSKAADLGDVLVIGLNTDASVKRLKGPSRPLQDEQTRALILSALQFVDYVLLFDEETPYELIKQVEPDVLVKGNDYKAEDIVGYDIVTAKGGKVITIELVQGHSTTGLISKMNS